MMQMTLRLLFNGRAAIVGCQSEFDSGVISFTHGNIRYRPTRAVVVWIEFIDLLHAVEGERDRTDRRQKLDYRRPPSVQLMMISTLIALLVGHTDAIASTRLELKLPFGLLNCPRV
jgi:hypothetical protein